MEILKGSVYRSSLGAIIVFMVLTVICWGKAGYVCSRGERQKCVWKLTNTLLFIAGILNVLETTIVGRNVSEQELILIPLYSFCEAIKQPEHYRSMLMNVFLFEPIGLALPFVLLGKLKKKTVITICFGFGLSLIVESIQYGFALGRTEIDDVICNTLGCALGTVAYLFYKHKIFKEKDSNDMHK